MKQRILLFTDWFEPGYKAGGPIRSCVQFVEQMKEKYAIHVFTSDRDLNAAQSYENIALNKWIRYNDEVEIFYCSPELLSWNQVRKQIKQVKPDFIYLNSMFSRYFTIYPLLVAWRGLTRAKIVLSPRGMLKSSALQFKQSKKKIYLRLFHWLNLHRLVTFHATDVTEQEDVCRLFGKEVRLILVSNFPGIVKDYPGSIPKIEKALSMIFIGRLHPIKNLDYLLTILPRIKGTLVLTIVGNEEDPDYVNRCKEIVQSFPPGLQVTFAGEMPNHQLPAVIARHHIFALPTRGENFGHAIFESLALGKPVLISDQTPWRNLVTEKAGWDIALQQPDQFVAALQQAIDFNQQQYDEWSKGAWKYVQTIVQQTDLKKAYYNLFS